MKLKVSIFILLSLTLFVNNQTAQGKSKKITVSGHVTDTGNKPVAGVWIVIDNEKTRIQTDNSGYYKIRIRSDADSISVLYQNYIMKSELIGARATIDFSLNEIDVLKLSRQKEGEPDKSVDIGYRKMNSKKTAVSVSNSDMLDLSKNENSMYHNIYEMIQGKVPGVDVNGQKIRIRGNNSLVGNNDPMFVVDGSPVSSIDNIMPNSVQSITVLKGTSATTYGSRGVNGVIVITLKKNAPRGY